VANPLDQAAAEATAIVQSARATAVILEAQGQATALIAGASGRTATAVPASAAVSALPVSTSQPALTPQPAALEPPTPASLVTSTQTVQVTGVGLAAEGGFLLVNFLAPPEVATSWYQGAVWVQDEATGQLYSEIGVIPVVGPLFGRPVEPGQPGYVMLVNNPNPLAPGAIVTVVLGDYRFEHLPVQ
jgi:hypothetical protein